MTEDCGNTILFVSNATLQKSIKKSLFTYLIFVKDLVSSKDSYGDMDLQDQMYFFKGL